MANEQEPAKTTCKVDTLAEALTLLNEHELQNTLRFATFYGRKDFGSTGKHAYDFFLCKIQHISVYFSLSDLSASF